MATVIITGGTGLVGKALRQALLEKSYKLIILTRNPPVIFDVNDPVHYAKWDVEKQTINTAIFKDADHIIHLAGENLAGKRWTARRKKAIVESRVNSSRLIVNTLNEIPNKIKTIISASGEGWYGEDQPGKKAYIETDPAADDFLGNLCKAWEESIEPDPGSGIRIVKFRIGVVMSRDGGALESFSKSLRFGIATILGSGKQMMSWIHIDDLVQMMIKAIEDKKLSGVYNAVSPAPVSNKAFTMTLAKRRNHFFIPVKVPGFLLKWVVGELGSELLRSKTVSADKIQETGFLFQRPTIEEALE